ncbi:MAG: hypothetical protein FWH20_10690 [Oscillospiraceae bacterium]|nr:hypothetical protein [Oscillospiraceae bacterium]
MANYKKLYYKLFNEITDTITAIDEIREDLVKIQQKTEHMIIQDERDEIDEAPSVETALNTLLRAVKEISDKNNSLSFDKLADNLNNTP